MTTLSSTLIPPGGQRILVIIAHPDDAESLCGGTIARLAEEGHDIHYLLVTRGDKGSNEPGTMPEHLIRIREQEQRAAAAILGVQTLTFLDGYRDSEIEVTLALRKDLVRAIRQWKPDILFTFDPWKRYEIHPDHRAVGLCAFDAVAAARGRMDFPEQLQRGLEPHKVQQVYFFSTDQPNHWVDISNVLKKKIAARCSHVSQIQPDNPPDGYLRRWAIEASTASGYVFAEAFHYYGL